MTDFGGFETLLRDRIGLDPGTIGPSVVGRAVGERLRTLAIPPTGVPNYLDLLRASDDEWRAFVDEVVTTETWFFRDQVPFRLLAERGARRASSERPFRVLSAPCSTGEEAYSAAIALKEAALADDQFHIDAIDISGRAVRAARAGLYSENAFRGSGEAFRGRYFTQSIDGYRVVPEIARLVEFRQGNLLAPNGLDDLPRHDVVLCRNLLIYLDEKSREALVDRLDRRLAPGGLLILGHADHVAAVRSRFRPTGPAGGFGYERAGDLGAPRITRPIERPAARVVPRAVTASPPPKGLADRTKSEAPAPSPATSPTLALPPPDLLDEASGLADQGRHAEADQLCERAIRERGPSARAYFLLGMIRQARGDHAAAERAFEKAVYLDPRHEDALLALSLVARRRGDLPAASRYHERSERAHRESRPR